MALLDAATGLRISELLGLKWSDVDFASLSLHVQRSIWHGKVGTCKTVASKKPLPLDTNLATELLNWYRNTKFNAATDWVFASPYTEGRQPYSPEFLLRKQIRPAAKRAGISARIGWHTFRRTVATLLTANNEDIKVVQELLRHANSRITLDIYAQAVTPAKRRAQAKIVNQLIGKPLAQEKENT